MMTRTMLMPITTPNRVLSPEELAHYDRQGFVIVPDVIPPKELAALDREIDRLVERPAGSISQLGLRSEVTRRMCEDDRLIDLVQAVVHPGVAIYSAKLVAKPPHNPHVCHWHQDDIYYNEFSRSDRRMSIWLPLQDADESNGCLWIVPGSHRRGMQHHEAWEHSHCRLAFSDVRETMPGAIPAPVRAGSVLLFSAKLWHGSRGNRTDQVRRAFIVSYQEATVIGGNGPQWKILRSADGADRPADAAAA